MVKRNNSDDALEKIVELMKADDSADAPSASLKWAKDLFRTRVREPKPTLLQRIVAVMSADLAPGRAAFGERSSAVSQERQLFFNAGKIGVDIRLARKGRHFDLRGQIFGEGFAGAEVRMVQADLEIAATVSERSEFTLKRISGGVYDLFIQSHQVQLVIEGLDLQN